MPSPVNKIFYDDIANIIFEYLMVSQLCVKERKARVDDAIILIDAILAKPTTPAIYLSWVYSYDDKEIINFY